LLVVGGLAVGAYVLVREALKPPTVDNLRLAAHRDRAVVQFSAEAGRNVFVVLFANHRHYHARIVADGLVHRSPSPQLPRSRRVVVRIRVLDWRLSRCAASPDTVTTLVR